MEQRTANKKRKTPPNATRSLEEAQPRRTKRDGRGKDDQFPIVAVGASAGGLEAFEAFFRPFPAKSGMAFVVVSHLDPRRESLLPSIMGRWTAMPVVQASNGDRIVPDKIFVIPPNSVMTTARGRLRIRKRRNPAERMPLDTFFASLAEDQGSRAVAIVLSGSGSDGALGIKAVKENGGLTLAQGSDGTEAQFKDMPEAAMATGLVDLVLPVEDIAGRLLAYARSGEQLTETPEITLTSNAAELRQIYSLVRARVGHDFSRYKERTFLRRVQRRMQVLQLSRLEDYVKRLQQDSNEATLLFRDLLIGVTHFFRDREAFAALETFVPRLFEGKGADDTVRVWVPGCATGEEAYSIAILLREYTDQLVGGVPKIQIFASDIDENSLATARNARYPAILLRNMPPARLNRFFAHEAETYRVVKELRDLVVFSAHSVIRDPPFSRIDLISCRNLLIYLNTDLQTQLIPLFHYALRPSGLLFLGTSENISRHGDLFASLDKKCRIFERQNLVSRAVVAFPPSGIGHRGELTRTVPALVVPEADAALATQLRLIAGIVNDNFAPAYVVVNKDGEVVHYSNRTGKYLEPAEGPPVRDVVAMTRGALRHDVRQALYRARETNEMTTVEKIPVPLNGGTQMIHLTVMPVADGAETLYVILFTDVNGIQEKASPKSLDEAEDSPVKQLERELRLTKERLLSTIEESDMSKEEMKSSNEELLSLNEELQSANEELETSKEEIQSINEELQTVNAELSSKVEEIDRANAVLKDLFESAQVGTIVLDDKLAIRSFMPSIEGIYNLIPSDRGRPLADIVNRLDHQNLNSELRGAIDRGRSVERRVTAREGRLHYLMRILPYRMLDKNVDGALLTFVEITNAIPAEDHEKILVAELNRRSQNALNTMISVAANTLRRSRTLKEFSNLLLERLRSLVDIHEALSDVNWGGSSMQELVTAVLVRRAGRKFGGVNVGGPDVLLTPPATLGLGVVLHELAVRSIERGALAVAKGRVDVAWEIKGSGRRKALELRWIERGTAAATARKKAEVGLDYTRYGVSAELAGTAKLDFRGGDLRCTIRLPAAKTITRRGKD